MDPTQLRFEELGKLRALKRTSKGNNFVEGSVVGTCQDMCPEYERLERQLHLDLTRPFETLPNGQVDPQRAVKKYHRPAAGNEAPLPEDVRPPPILLRTLDHLLSPHVLLRTDVPFLETQKFLRDRMRSLRQDLTLQNSKSFEAVHINQCIARFHIYCGVVLREAAKAEFDPFQNLEQLRKVLQTLYELYEDGHKHGRISRTPIVFEKEAEFRAYRILAHLDDPNEAYDDSAPAQVQAHPQFRNALELANAFHTSNSVRFRQILNSESFLFQALAFQWLPALQQKLTIVEEKAMERAMMDRVMMDRAMEPILVLDVSAPNFQGPLDVLIKSGCVDERSLKLKSDFQALIYHQLLQSLLPQTISHLGEECLGQRRKELERKQAALEEQRAQERKRMEEERIREEREHTLRKQALIEQVTKGVLTDAVGLTLNKVAEEEIGRYHADRYSETKHALAQVIYDSCLNVCVPYYLKRIMFDSLSERKYERRVKKRVFNKLLHYSSSNRKSIKAKDNGVEEVLCTESGLESGLLEVLLGRADGLSREHPLYKKYNAACIDIVSNKPAWTDEQKIIEIERQYPPFIFTTSHPSLNITISSRNNNIGVGDELKDLKRMLAVEQEHTRLMELRLKELIKGD